MLPPVDHFHGKLHKLSVQAPDVGEVLAGSHQAPPGFEMNVWETYGQPHDLAAAAVAYTTNIASAFEDPFVI